MRWVLDSGVLNAWVGNSAFSLHIKYYAVCLNWIWFEFSFNLGQPAQIAFPSPDRLGNALAGPWERFSFTSKEPSRKALYFPPEQINKE